MKKKSLILFLALLFSVVGCNSNSQQSQSTAAPDFKVVGKEDGRVMEVELTSQNPTDISSILEQADKMDGTEDRQVHKCAGCKLNMDGDSSHAVQVAGYELHYCSDDCRTRFLANPGTNLLALKTRFEIK